MEGQMSAELEAQPVEAPFLHPDSELGQLLDITQKEEYPAFLGWSTELAENTYGYIVQAGGTRRVVAVIEQMGEKGSTWLAETFRVRRETDEPELFEEVCRQMMTEASDYHADQSYVLDRLHNLYLGKGMELQYAHVILECNDPSTAESTGGAHSVIYSRLDSERQANFDELSPNITDIIQKRFKDEPGAEATLAYDIGTHMGEMPTEFHLDTTVLTVYRTRFHNYPWAFEDGDPLINDLVLVKLNEGGTWFVGDADFDQEVDRGNVETYLEYGRQIIASDVPNVVIGGLIKRIRSTKKERAPSFLMVDHLEHRSEEDVREFLEEVGSPYTYFEELGA